MRYRLNSDGTKTPIAGRGKAEYGASTVRQGVCSFENVNAGTYKLATVTFDTPMPDTDYVVETYDPSHALGIYSVTNKSVTGFIAYIYNPTSSIMNNPSIKYTAFKLYTDTEYNGLIGTRLDETVDLTNYTSSFYTTKSDGYICLGIGTSSSGMAGITVYDSNENALCSMLVRPDADRLLAYSCQSLYVKKGMKIKMNQNTLDGTDYEAAFRSLKI